MTPEAHPARVVRGRRRAVARVRFAPFGLGQEMLPVEERLPGYRILWHDRSGQRWLEEPASSQERVEQHRREIVNALPPGGGGRRLRDPPRAAPRAERDLDLVSRRLRLSREDGP